MTDLTREAMHALGAQLLGEALIIFPVRHHSPACALQLMRLMAERAPSVVLIEGPREFTPLIPLLTHQDAQAPFAIYTYAVQRLQEDEEDSRRGAYYPFCDYSPELVALREASRLGVPARFMDLNFSEQSSLEQADLALEETASLLDEKHYQQSLYLSRLGQQLGCRDHEELWEHLFESRAASLSLQTHIDQVVTYCFLARLDTPEGQLIAEGCLQREAEMAWHIQQALAQRQPGEGPVLAVMGGFHGVVMPALLAHPVPRPQIENSVRDAHSALIRYSFERLDRLNGYTSGMTSPAWHQGLWQSLLKQERLGHQASARLHKEQVLTVLSEVAFELRSKHGVELSMPLLAGAYQQSLQLATLRGRPAPLRNDLLDGITSCFIKGEADAEGALIQQVAQQILCGSALGKVPAGTGLSPLLKDFQTRARRLRLKIDDSERHRLILDLYRRPEHRLCSRLLHGLSLLDVPFAVRLAGPDFIRGSGLGRLQEHWEYSYTPMSEAALIEASLYGVTLPLAVANRFVAKLDRQQAMGSGRDAQAAAGYLIEGCVLGLHDHLERVMTQLRLAIGEDASFVRVASATTSLGLLWESREPLEARALEELPEVLQAAYQRAIFLAGDLPASDAEDTVASLLQLRELLYSSAGRELDKSLYWQLLEQLYRQHASALFRGACAGLLYAADELSAAQLGHALKGHLDGLVQAKEAVAFLQGLLRSAREVAWQLPEVLQVVEQLLESWEEPEFLDALPELRLAFAEMTPLETDRIAAAVAQLHQTESLGELVNYGLSEGQLGLNLELSQAVREVLEAEGLSWGSHR